MGRGTTSSGTREDSHGHGHGCPRQLELECRQSVSGYIHQLTRKLM